MCRRFEIINLVFIKKKFTQIWSMLVMKEIIILFLFIISSVPEGVRHLVFLSALLGSFFVVDEVGEDLSKSLSSILARLT